MRTGPLVAVLAVVVAGCTADAGVGQADPDSSGSASPSPPITSSPFDLPERPRSLDVVGVDPCTLLPKAERAGLEIDRPPVSGIERGEDEPVFKAPLCTFSVNEWGAYGVVASDKYTAREWLDDLAQPMDASIIDVGDFPAVLFEPTISPDECYVVVDIATDSSLYVVSYDRREEPEFRTKVCDATLKAADVALKTLEGMQ